MAATVSKCPMNLDEVDLFSPGAQEYWFDAYKILHEEEPVLRIPGEGAFPGTDGFVITKYEDIADIIADPYTFPQPTYGGGSMSAGGGGMSAPSAGMSAPPVAPAAKSTGGGAVADAMARNTLRPNMEMHKQHRIQLTDPWVGATGAPRHREMITRTVDQLIDGWIDKGEINFVTEFAALLPQIVMTTILGFPLEDMPKLKTWGEAQVRRFVYGTGHRNLLTPEEEMENAQHLGEFMAYVQEQVTRKRSEPGDDMTSFLTQVDYYGRKLTDTEVIGDSFDRLAPYVGRTYTIEYDEGTRSSVILPGYFGPRAEALVAGV